MDTICVYEGVRAKIERLALKFNLPKESTILIVANLATKDDDYIRTHTIFFESIGCFSVNKIVEDTIYRAKHDFNLFTMKMGFDDKIRPLDNGCYCFTVPEIDIDPASELEKQSGLWIDDDYRENRGYIEFFLYLPNGSNLNSIVKLQNEAPSFWHLIKSPKPVLNLKRPLP